ncbi:type II toxin-antitoxin system RelE/ParE family toxin [soil metagenome]
MTRFVLRPKARADLDGIWNDTARHWSPEQAERYIRLIMQACNDVSVGIVSGSSAETIRADYFKLPIGSHIVFYRVGEGSVLDIIRILHQRLDLESAPDAEGDAQSAYPKSVPLNQ